MYKMVQSNLYANNGILYFRAVIRFVTKKQIEQLYFDLCFALELLTIIVIENIVYIVLLFNKGYFICSVNLLKATQ